MAAYLGLLALTCLLRTTAAQEDYGDLILHIGDPSIPLEPMCEPDARIPDDLITCGSCKGRCGNTTEPSDNNPTHHAQCSCDVSCGFHGDCCQDYRMFCLEEYMEFQQMSTVYPFTRRHDEFQCRRFSGNGPYLVVHTCPDGSGCKFTEELNEDVNSFVPMYDVNRGLHYINGHCAVCNGANKVIPWGVTVMCSRSPTPGEEEEEEFMQTGVLNSEESFTSLRENTKSCSLEYTKVGQPRRCYESFVSSCSPGCQNRQLISACESGPYEYTTFRSVTYKNLHCALCNAGDGEDSSQLSCGQNIFRSPPIADRDIPFDSFSLTMVFDFDPRNGLKIGTPECPDEEVYVPNENVCRRIACPSGFVLDGSDCIPEPSNITAVVTGTFVVEPSEQTLQSLNNDKIYLETFIEQDVTATFDSYNIRQDNMDIETFVEVDNKKLSVSSRISCNCNYESLFAEQTNKTIFEDFENSIANKIRKGVLMYLPRDNINLESVRSYVKSSMNWSSPFESERLDCTWLVYQKNETKSEDGSITVLASGRSYPKDKNEVLDNVVLVCESSQEHNVRTVDNALSILTLVCLSISILCLSVRILLQFFIFSFDSKPGKIQLQMTIALLLAFILLIIGPFLSEVTIACPTAAILMAYEFLAAFTWMNVIAVDTWLVFRPSSAFSRSEDDTSSLWKHYVVGWGIPLLLVAPSVVMNYVEVDSRFKPDFGGARCWYTQRYAMLVLFGVPIGISILLNTVLYIHTAINLHQAFKNALSAMKAERYHFAVYVKLFILMGITWIFGFISAFTDQIVVDFIFVILTSLQGLFLFISFVCNKRVAMEIRKTVKSETSVTLSNRGTKSTPIPSYDSHDRGESKV